MLITSVEEGIHFCSPDIVASVELVLEQPHHCLAELPFDMAEFVYWAGFPCTKSVTTSLVKCQILDHIFWIIYNLLSVSGMIIAVKSNNCMYYYWAVAKMCENLSASEVFVSQHIKTDQR